MSRLILARQGLLDFNAWQHRGAHPETIFVFDSRASAVVSVARIG